MQLKHQIFFLVFASFVLGAINNLRPRAHIPWVQKWVSVEETKAKSNSATENFLDRGQVEKLLVENQGKGPTDIFFSTAKSIFDHGKDLTFWIDARDETLFNQGHIPGAVLLDFYNQMDYLPEVEPLIQQKQPVSLVVYCKEVDCPDSHMLAESLFHLGYDNIFVYKGGWAEWHDEKNLPFEGTLASSEPQAVVPEQTKEKQQGMYLEDIARDLVPFFAGLFFLLFWKCTSGHLLVQMCAALLTGLFFIWAAVSKIINPFLFAKSVWNYNLVPDFSINLMGLTLPWIEFLAGLGLILGMIRPGLRPYLLKGSSLLISLLLVIFIGAVSFNVLRGHEFTCGCTSQTVYFETYYFAGWNDKYTLLLRDLGLLAMSLSAFFFKPAMPTRIEG